MATPSATVLDVIENALGSTEPIRAGTLTLAEIDELAELVIEFYDAWEAPKDESTLTAYSGGGLGLSQAGDPNVDYLYASLLYYPRVVVHDPFASWFNRDRDRLNLTHGPRLRSDELWATTTEYVLGSEYFAQRSQLTLEEARNTVRRQLTIVRTLEPLIRSGAVVPIPAWKIVRQRQQAIAAAMRHDIADDALLNLLARNTGGRPDVLPRVGDFSYAAQGIPPNMKLNQLRYLVLEAPSFYLNKLVSIADELGAVYVPPAEADHVLLNARLDRLPREVRARSRIELRLVRDIAAVRLPLFTGLPAQTLVKIRQDEEAFADFRDTLATAYRSVQVSPEDSDFAAEMREALRAALDPRVREVQRLTSAQQTLKAAALAGATELVLGAVALIGGTPPLFALGPAIPAALLRMLLRPKATGANMVLQALARR
ncbi:MAG: hypothetical protein ACJ74O_02670 [Frankiaceae bacterium]